jgi:hypothetical protein
MQRRHLRIADEVEAETIGGAVFNSTANGQGFQHVMEGRANIHALRRRRGLFVQEVQKS